MSGGLKLQSDNPLSVTADRRREQRRGMASDCLFVHQGIPDAKIREMAFDKYDAERQCYCPEDDIKRVIPTGRPVIPCRNLMK